MERSINCQPTLQGISKGNLNEPKEHQKENRFFFTCFSWTGSVCYVLIMTTTKVCIDIFSFSFFLTAPMPRPLHPHPCFYPCSPQHSAVELLQCELDHRSVWRHRSFRAQCRVFLKQPATRVRPTAAQKKLDEKIFIHTFVVVNIIT